MSSSMYVYIVAGLVADKNESVRIDKVFVNASLSSAYVADVTTIAKE